MTNGLYIIHYYTLKINQTIKLVKLFETFNMRSVVLDNRLKMLFPFINAVIDESLRRAFQLHGQLFQIGVAGKLSPTTALINGNNTSRSFIKNN